MQLGVILEELRNVLGRPTQFVEYVLSLLF